jgi:Uma2 family endonuclease
MAVGAKRIPVTEDAYFEMLEKSDVKLEYWAGTVVGMAGASDEHCDIEMNLTGAILPQLKGSECKARSGNQAVFVASRNAYVFPDLSVTCGKMERVERKGISCLLNPTVIFEVLSPSTSSRDETEKLFAYTSLRSVREYVLVYADRYCVKVHARIQPDEMWKTSLYEELDAVFALASCGVELSLTQIYEAISFSEHPDDGIGQQGPESKRD